MARDIILPTIASTTEDFDELEHRIVALFKEQIYLPMLYELGLPKRTLMNSLDDLLDAIRKGTISYYRGAWSGKFSAGISRELKRLGATWDRKGSKWVLPADKLPLDVAESLRLSAASWRGVLQRIDQSLQKMMPEEIASKLVAEKLFDSTLWKTDKKMQGNLKGITVIPELDQKMRAEIARGYTDDIKRYVTDFTKKEIGQLRKSVEQATLQGVRSESLVDDIQKSFQISRNKAKFLARQETNLMMGKFTETRYVAGGLNEYQWTCVRMPKDKTPSVHVPGNVRYAHGILDGTRQQWNNPPVTTNPGEPVRRNHPQQDYNCRCKARPIVKF